MLDGYYGSGFRRCLVLEHSGWEGRMTEWCMKSKALSAVERAQVSLDAGVSAVLNSSKGPPQAMSGRVSW